MPRKIRGYSQCPHRLPIFALAPPKKSLNPDWNEAQGSLRCRNVQRNWSFRSFTVVWAALGFCLFMTNAPENPRLQPVSPQITYFRTRTPQKIVKSGLERSSVLGQVSYHAIKLRLSVVCGCLARIGFLLIFDKCPGKSAVTASFPTDYLFSPSHPQQKCQIRAGTKLRARSAVVTCKKIVFFHRLRLFGPRRVFAYF